MENVLLGVALVSGAVAVAMCAIVLKMTRDERRRTDARMEALLAMAAEPDVPIEPAHTSAPLLRSSPPFEAQPASPWPQAPALDAAVQQRERDDHDLELRADVNERRDRSSTEGAELFAQVEQSSPWPRRIAAAAAAAAVVTAGVLALGLRHDGTMDNASIPSVSVGAAPLELLSLNHVAEPGTLTISGVVQNPRGGAAVSNATAVAFLFAPDGGFLASGRAPLDYTRLEPGNDSPFVVKVPVKRAVARYRVSFRGPDGAIIAHVDKRTAAPIARK